MKLPKSVFCLSKPKSKNSAILGVSFYEFDTMINLDYLHGLALLESRTCCFIELSDVYEFKLPFFPEYALIGENLINKCT